MQERPQRVCLGPFYRLDVIGSIERVGFGWSYSAALGVMRATTGAGDE